MKEKKNKSYTVYIFGGEAQAVDKEADAAPVTASDCQCEVPNDKACSSQADPLNVNSPYKKWKTQIDWASLQLQGVLQIHEVQGAHQNKYHTVQHH